MAYQNGSLPIPAGLDQTQFLVAMAEKFGAFSLLWIIEDANSNFKSGRGQVAIVGVRTDGWAYEPKAWFFKWATARNRVKSAVGFLQMMRHQKEVGVCRVEVLDSEAKKLRKLEKYGVLYPRGRVPFGNSEGDSYLFSIQGKKAK